MGSGTGTPAIPNRVTFYWMLYMNQLEVRIQMVGNPLVSRDLSCHLDQVIYTQNGVLGLHIPGPLITLWIMTGTLFP